MAFEDFSNKDSVVIVYTGDGKGKTSASLGLMVRALGNRWTVAFIQFIKYWGVGEHVFIRDIQSIYKEELYFYKGGKGFYEAGDLSEHHISSSDHKHAAQETFKVALDCVSSGKFDLVVCDEINNAVNDGLLNETAITNLISERTPKTSLCMTGRNFPSQLLDQVDIATDMKKIKHHFDDKFLANKGIDY
ncbi:MAG: cob(I)yrinic acid a,c-diamide adenosyltransferase [Candidatus Saccharimonadales bacterium]